jgi:hypothetical protein
MYRLGSIASQVVQSTDKVLCPVGQVFGFLGMRSWWPAIVGLLRFHPHLEPAAASSSLVSPTSAVSLLLVVAVSSEISHAAAETALMADVNSASVAELFLVMLVLFFIS